MKRSDIGYVFFMPYQYITGGEKSITIWKIPFSFSLIFSLFIFSIIVFLNDIRGIANKFCPEKGSNLSLISLDIKLLRLEIHTKL